jgi:hypothetical protein
MYADWEQEYPGQIEMVGWFPNPTVTSAEITEFGERYAVDWELERDTVGWSDGLSAKYTPEVFVLDSTGAVRYQGRINDFISHWVSTGEVLKMRIYEMLWKLW